MANSARLIHLTGILLASALGAAAAAEPPQPSPEAEARARAWMPTKVEVSGTFQYAFEGAPDAKGRIETAYLWLPPKAETIRGLVVAADLMMEANFIADPYIRAACEEQAIGIIFFDRGLPSNFKGGDDPTLATALEALAKESGYPELTTVPILPIGHSAASPKIAEILNAAPERCFAGLTYKGAQPIPTDKPLERLRGIPTLHVQDFVEEYKDRRETGSIGRMNVANIRAKDTQVLSGIIEDNGSKHPAWCFYMAPLIAEFIRASAELRIGEDGKTHPVPVEAGALVDKNYGAPRFATAPAAEYKGDPSEAMWFPSLKMANMVTDYNQVQLAKEPQYIAFVDPASGKPLGEKNAPAVVFVEPDVFEVNATFLDKSDNPALPQDPVTHADGPILFAPHGRTLELVAPGRFRQIYHPTAVRWVRITAYNMGDATHRIEVAHAELRIPNPGGKEQTITFPEIAPVKRDSLPLQLGATSDAGLPVRYCVEYGPATVDEAGNLTLAEVPAKAPYPLKIKVTACQFGSHLDPRVQPAEKVSRIIEVL